MTTNPFTYGTMITDPDQFIGRRAELEQIVARLNGSQPQGSAVVGARRIGKSSLLHYLTRPRPAETLRPRAGLGLVYLSAAAGNCDSPAHFRLTLLRRLLQAQPLDHRSDDGKWLTDWQQRLASAADCSWDEARQALDNLPHHPVVCLDEFEALLADPFDDRFFNALRSWANEGLLSWVTASAQPLPALAKLHGHTSPFFNILGTVALAGFSDIEVSELFDRANETPYPFTAADRRQLRDLAGNHPYHLQIVAWKLWEMKQARQVDTQALRHHLCQQSSPPAHCTAKPRRLSVHHLLVGLVIILVVIIAGLVWTFVPGGETWFLNGWLALLYLMDGCGWLGGVVTGLIIVVGIGQALKAHFFEGKSWAEVSRDLWEKLR
jgi:hypothetical protein